MEPTQNPVSDTPKPASTIPDNFSDLVLDQVKQEKVQQVGDIRSKVAKSLVATHPGLVITKSDVNKVLYSLEKKGIITKTMKPGEGAPYWEYNQYTHAVLESAGR